MTRLEKLRELVRVLAERERLEREVKAEAARLQAIEDDRQNELENERMGYPVGTSETDRHAEAVRAAYYRGDYD